MFYDVFKRLCDEKGISCNRAATEIGLSNATATKWKKTGATPSGDTLSKIADFFGVSVDYLLGNEEKEQPALSKEDELQDEFFAFYGEVKPYLDERDIDDLKIFMKAKAEHKRKMQDDKG